MCLTDIQNRGPTWTLKNLSSKTSFAHVGAWLAVKPILIKEAIT